MITITVPETEMFDNKENRFFLIKETKIKLEHSLISVSKWESKWKIPFLFKSEEKTVEQTMDYIKCMTINDVNENVYSAFTNENFSSVKEYIESPMSATWFREKKQQKKSSEIITSELIYYWMVLYNIPLECEKWHLNRLLTLIRICSIKAEEHIGGNKMSKNSILSENQLINLERRAKFNSRG
ncbi:MAG: hypothetical protein HUJ78_01145 [Mogibacterium sp.]|nr:hypothetical protein [Mogibacterium sp.]MCF0232926.1 hypothetical protein [Enterococcus sp.]